MATGNHSNEARLDVSAIGFWRPHERKFIIHDKRPEPRNIRVSLSPCSTNSLMAEKIGEEVQCCNDIHKKTSSLHPAMDYIGISNRGEGIAIFQLYSENMESL